MKITKSLLICSFVLITGVFCSNTGGAAYAYDPDAVSYNDTGISYTKKGNYEQAISYFKKAIETDSSLTNAYYNLGSVYKYSGNKDKAIKAFQLLLRNSPGDDEAAFILASMYFEKQDYEKALIYTNSIGKSSQYYKDSTDLFMKINKKLNDSVIEEVSIPKNTSKYTFVNFKGPAGIAENSKGNLYTAEYASNTIKVMSPDGKLLETISHSLIKGPVGIAIDSKDNIYVANYALNNIVKITKDAVVTVVLKDVLRPYYLYINKSDVLYVSEQNKNTVIRLGIMN